mgnify:CR=1 FL=1
MVLPMKYKRSLRQRLFHQRRFRLLLLALLVFSLGLGLLIVPLERGVGNIETVSDGIWWAVTTLTTVGYGDYVPVTFWGRILGILLQVLGAMMFGMVIAIISTYVSRSQEEFYWNRLFDRLNKMDEDLDKMQRKTAFMVRDSQTKDEEN